jgi:hypothetical protein
MALSTWDGHLVGVARRSGRGDNIEADLLEEPVGLETIIGTAGIGQSLGTVTVETDIF